MSVEKITAIISDTSAEKFKQQAEEILDKQLIESYTKFATGQLEGMYLKVYSKDAFERANAASSQGGGKHFFLTHFIKNLFHKQ